MSGKPVIKLKRNKESRKQQEAKDEEFVRKLIAMESEQQLQEEKHRRRITQTQEEKDAEYARKLAEKQNKAYRQALQSNPNLAPNGLVPNDPNFQGSNNSNNNNNNNPLLSDKTDDISSNINHMSSNSQKYDNSDYNNINNNNAGMNESVVDGLLSGPPKKSGIKSRLVGLLKRDKGGDNSEYINARIEARKQEEKNNYNNNNNSNNTGGGGINNNNNNNNNNENVLQGGMERRLSQHRRSQKSQKTGILELWQRAQMQLISGEVQRYV